VPQWDASLRFDQRAALPGVTALVHVIAFAEDVEAPPEDGEELARLIPGAKFHLLEGLGHGSWYGLAHEEINKVWRGLYRRIDNRACALR
jgi:pimeloyl-ACP methyl ester carboxylesterase